MTRAEKAKEYFKEGYNCCQAVVLAFCDTVDIDEHTALMVASSFGGGMGRLREVCGAVSGMFIILGLKQGYISPTANDEKMAHYENIRKLAREFEEKNSSIICKTLIADGGKKPCAELVYDAAEILDAMIG